MTQDAESEYALTEGEHIGWTGHAMCWALLILAALWPRMPRREEPIQTTRIEPDGCQHNGGALDTEGRWRCVDCGEPLTE